MPKQPATQQFILLPSRGLRASHDREFNAESGSFLVDLAHASESASSTGVLSSLPGLPDVKARVIDSIHEDGAKLVEMSPSAALALRARHPGLRLLPIVWYELAIAPRASTLVAPPVPAARGAAMITVTVTAADHHPVVGAMVVAFTDFAARRGAQGKTNARGQVRLTLGGASRRIDRLYVYPPENGLWGFLRRNFLLRDGFQVSLQGLDLAFTDCLRFFYGNSPDGAGQGVTIGVIDCGIDTNHPDLHVEGGANTVPGENPSDFGPNGSPHGTHVAGIIAASGRPPAGLRGLAPAVRLRSYRVFGQGQREASNYAIIKAIDAAVTDQCDLINMSLGGGAPDAATIAAIADARAQGSLCIIAAGNDDRRAVSFPASDPLALAVSALGRIGTFPATSVEAGDVEPPFGTDRKNFIAAFSNVGPALDLVGPGVGVMSTIPGGYAPMSGTSMACPAVTGAAAKLLAIRPDLLSMARNQVRSNAIAGALFASAKTLGFQPEFEGHGLLS
ncbi:MAG TPA: S8 family serine peptidase [Candidatus Dormibacteraeota bacterium]|nr:S8 family serine peptidase [Candidatus Dormibacteraeota bacterium]